LTINIAVQGHIRSTPLRVLLTGGRAPVTLDLARMLKRTGHKVYVAESMQHHLCSASSAVDRCFAVPPPRQERAAYLDALESLIKFHQIDVLIPMCEEIFHVARGAERLREHCRVLAPAMEQLHRLHHKHEFILLARSLGLPVPETRLIESRRQWIEEDADLQAKGHWVWKPAYSRFASKVRLPKMRSDGNRRGALSMPLHDFSQTRRPFRNDPPEGDRLSPASPWVAQSYIEGRGVCTYSIAHEGTMVAHTAYDNRFRTGRAGASVHFEHLEHEQALRWVRRFVEGINYSGQISFDFMETPEGQVFAIECNPRATSGIHLFGSGEELVSALLAPERLASKGCMVVPEPAAKAMLLLPMLGVGLKYAWTPSRLRKWAHAWKGARDVVYARGDGRPWLQQPRIVLDAWRIARNHRVSLTEALTHDIEWNGEQQ